MVGAATGSLPETTSKQHNIKMMTASVGDSMALWTFLYTYSETWMTEINKSWGRLTCQAVRIRYRADLMRLKCYWKELENTAKGMQELNMV